MNIGTRLLLSAALAVGSTVGAAALGQNVVRDDQADVGPSAPQSIPASAALQAGGDGAGSGAADGAATGTAGGAGSGAADSAEADAESDADPDDRAAGVRAELASAAAAGEISWDAAERVSDELGGYIRGDVSVADIA